jgi:hypothetical protein
MSLLLLPELARENAASNWRAAHSVETEAQLWDTLRHVDDKLATLRRKVAWSAREAVRHTLVQASESRSLWQGTLSLFDDGLEGDEAREVLQAVLAVFESWFGLVKSTRELSDRAVQAGVAPEALTELDAAVRDIEVIQRTAQQMRGFLGRPLPPVDPLRLAKARQTVAQGQFKDPEAIRAQLRELPQ